MDRKNVEDIYRLSPVQQGILYHALYDPEGVAYFEQFRLEIPGRVDPELLAEMWRRAVARQGALRTSFIWKGLEEPVQVVHKEVELPVAVHDLSGGSEEEIEARAAEILAEDRRRGFDLSKAPLVRLTLLRLEDERWLVALSYHHIIMDGWSYGVVAGELEAIRQGIARGEEPDLPPVRPFREYVGWLRRQDPAAAREYWRRSLEGFEAPTPLTWEAIRGHASRQEDYGEVHRSLDRETSARLLETARRLQVTANTLLQGAWGYVLSRVAGRSDVTFGTTVSGRPPSLPGVERMVGCFINSLPVRTVLPEDRTAPLGDWLRALQDGQKEMRRYEHTPLPEVRQAAGVTGDVDLFHSIVVFENFDADLFEGSSVRRFQRTNFPLTVVVEPRSELSVLFTYDRLHLSDPVVEGLLDHYLATLAALAHGARTLADLPAVPPRDAELSELGELTAPAAVPPAPVPSEDSLVDRFLAAAAEHGARVAVEGETLSGDEVAWCYEELAETTGRAARRLAAAGVGPETLVGLAAPRTVELVGAILGIVRAGGAYLPLDPSAPADRLAFMVEDSGAPVVVATPETRDALAESGGDLDGVTLLDLEELLAPAADLPETDPEATGADGLAYVIYTSGSTGRPKGTLVPHRQVVRLLDATAPWFSFRSDDVWTLFHSSAFDFSVWELWGPLTTGGRLVVVPYWVSREPAEFRRLLAERAVTVLNQTPSAFRQLAAADAAVAGGDADELALRVVVFGGEALEPTSLAGWVERHGLEAPRLINMYGITETTVHVTYHRVTGDEVAGRGSASPVGVAIPDLSIDLTDFDGLAVPVGVPGEIRVGGAGLARGYLGRPGLTAERFVPAPEGFGERHYRSGDLARRILSRRGGSGGGLEFLGRIDHQVKIRGFRIELGEIEAVLAAAPEVAQVAVLVREAGAGDQRLVAYLVAADESTPSTEALKERCRETLPDYMVPAAFVVLERFPLTVNGKLDRQALPAPEDVEGTAGGTRPEAGEAPSGPVEEMLAGIWSEVLGVPTPGRRDDFFDLGGHSLLATRLATKIRSAFRVEVALRELFEAPELAQMARCIEAAGAGGGEAAPPLVGLPREPQDASGEGGGELRFPVSFSQERLLFIDRLETGGALYNLPSALDLHGPLDAGALAASLAALGRRHETLRTTFDRRAQPWPEAVVAPEPRLALPVVDLATLPAERREAEGARLTARHVRRPFDLDRGPLARFQLLRLTPEHHALVAVFHHIVSDGWSLEVANRELLAGYAARLEGRRPELPELPVQYGDFAAWQRGWLEGEVLERQIDWWREHLAGAPAVLDLPFDRPRPAVQGFEGTTLAWQLPEETAAELRRFARGQGATVFMVLLGLYGWFLGSRAGVDDVTVGTPVAGRTRAETEGLVGFFVNTLVLRTTRGGQPTVGELVTRARETTLGAHAHQDVPFEKLVEELSPPRSLAHSPLFQVMLALQAAGAGGGPEAKLPGGLSVGGRPHGAGISKFELTLNVFDPGAGPLPGHWVYRTALWDEATIERMGRSFAALVAAAVEEPKRPAVELPTLTAAERREVLVGWNRPPVDYPVAAMTPALVAAVAEGEPSRLAVRFRGESLSYGELVARARRLAARLVARGVGPDVVVGVAAPRSFELVVALLAVMEAGGAYLPLDPQLPDERLELMLDDARVPLVLAGSDHAERLERLSDDAEILPLEPLVEDVARGSDDPLPALPPVTPEATAYVLYTSGSTGRPKGVAVSHGALAGRLAYGLAGDLHPDVRFLHKTTISFDVSILEVFGPLVVGAVTVLAKPGGEKDPAYLTRLIADERVTHTSFPPSLLYALLEEDDFQALDSLEVVITGGETVPAELPERFYARMARPEGQADQADGQLVELRNRYGPTETSISVTSWTARPGVSERVLPIGRPTAKAQLFVLGPDARPVPVGATGEVVVGGPVVARGYLGRPRETAAAFVPHPIPELAEAGARVYRTGDLARWRVLGSEDASEPEATVGALEFAGRADQQVKIRGFRIELGEIETRLARMPGVREAAVEAWGEGAGRYLAAYLVPETTNGHGGLDPAALAARLSETLPSYMVPGAFVTLDSLPLGPTGKVDRGALPEPAERGVGRVEFEAPRGRVEETIAGLWTELVGAERVGRGDDFFDLGGHSLLATRLTGRLQDSLGVEVPLRTLFESPTLAEYAAAVAERMAGISEAEGDGDAGPIPALPRAGDGTDAFPLSFAQERLWFLDRFEPGGSTYNVTGAVRLRGDLVLGAVAAGLDRLILRHEGLRTVFAAGPSGSPEQRVRPAAEASMPLGVVDLSGLAHIAPERAEAEATRVRARGADTPFFLETGPLARARLLRLGPTDHVLALELHHIVSDAWSMGILVAEFAACYRTAVSGGDVSPLPELPVQYPDFAAWQRRHLGAGALDAQLAWWRETLAGAPPVTPLPTDRPRGTSASARGATLPLALPEEMGRAVVRHAREHGASPFMVVMAAFQALLARLSGEDDLVVGTTMAHRPRPELEGLVGFFINTLPIRVQARDDRSFAGLTDAVRDAVFAAEEHQDLPFERLVAELDLPRDRSHSPVFQVLLQMVGGAAAVGAPGAAPEALPGLAAERLGDTSQSAKFDLILNLAARGDGLAGQWRYRTDLFERETVERFSGALTRLLEGALAAPETPLAALPLLSAAERRELVEERRPVPVAAGAGGATLVERLDAVFAAHPDRPAVTFPATGQSEAGDGKAVGWTYRELDARSTRLARHLRSLGAGPDVPVGLFLGRTPRLVEAVVGTVRSGAAYVPVDPAYPAERIAFTLADAGVVAVVTDRASMGELPTLGDLAGSVPVVVLDDLPEVSGTSPELSGTSEESTKTGISEEVPEVSGTFPDVSGTPAGTWAAPAPDHLAYVIYTSGSTGRPKGVEVTHRNAVRLLDATEPWFSFGPDDVWTLFHSYAFDFSVWELWGALATGGRLVVVPRDVSRDPAAFRALLADEGVTILNQTPSAFGQLVAADRSAESGAEPLSALREVIFGGETLAPGSLAPWVERYGLEAPRLVNMYGITETTVHVTYRPVTADDVAQGSVSLIGQAIPDLGLYVTDRHLQPVPRGVPGELVVAGAGLARGYLGRPALTAERFVPDPFSDLPGARLYRSGDRARTLPAGDHEYLGRIDHQVKVRGFRIELGEIEAALERIDAVERAVVTAVSRFSGSGAETRLVAYLVATEGAELPSTSELRRLAAETLPDYMVPSMVVPLDSVPLTSSGKVDRRALPDPDEAERAELGTERVAPRDPVEELVASLWAEVLDSGEPGVHDDFFDAGGSSLAGAVLVNRLQEALGEILQVVVIFDHPTVAELAGYLRREHPEAVVRKLGVGVEGEGGPLDAPLVTGEDVSRLVSLVEPMPPMPPGPARDELPKNPPAVFVLAPPRSGTTLLRVMLGGHPDLFAPPELELLSFNTLGERRDAFAGRDAFWLEGLVRAVMEALGVDADEASARIAEMEAEDLPVRVAYGRLQEWLGGRLLVDKTPSYALDPEILRRAEEDFDGARYVHLVRHPYGMIRSFEEAKLDQIFFRKAHGFARRRLAELIWTVSHANILEFLETIPQERRVTVSFAHMVTDPEGEMRRVAEALRIGYDPAMARPYEERRRRMTDGPHEESRMLGDVKFHQHAGIDPAVATRWRQSYHRDFLGDPTWEMAARLGIDPAVERAGRWVALEATERTPGEPAPTSFAQERLWFLDRMDPGNAVYHIPASFRLRGPLDIVAFGRSFRRLSERHESLRTGLALIDGEPMQVIEAPGPEAGLGLPVADLTALPEERREEAREAATLQTLRTPFDLRCQPLARTLLVCLGPEHYAVAFVMHHVVSDGWSLGVLVRELGTVYRALAAGEEPVLPELPVQYADVAVWQRRYLDGALLDEQVEYWRNELEGVEPLALPTDRPRSAVQRFRGGDRSRPLPEDLLDGLDSLGRDAGVTRFMALWSIYAALVARHSGQRDLTVGTPIANRTREQTEGVVGFFVNTLVLRARFGDGETYRSLLAQARQTSMGAFGHQDVPFQKVVEAVEPRRDLSRPPLFQTLFVMEADHGRSGGLALPGLRAEPLFRETATSKFDLSVNALGMGGQGTGLTRWQYDRDLFDGSTIERMIGHFHVFLEAAIAHPDRPLVDLPLLDDAERRQLSTWNETAVVYPEVAEDADGPLLHDLVARRIETSPDAPALTFDGETVDFAELGRRAHRLAHRLRSLGVGPESLVGVALPRSLELPVALYAVLEAGGAYLPLDPDYPPERLALMVEDSGARVILTREELVPILPEGAAKLVLLDREDFSDQPATRPARPAVLSGQSAAYVIYTSGSTGRPKGVVNRHRGIVNRLLWMQQEYALDGTDAVLQKTPASFDVSVWEFFWPLVAGARLVMARPGEHRDPGSLARTVEAEGVTTMHFVPSMLQVFLANPGVGERLGSLRRVIASGEALPRDLVERWYQTAQAPLHNLYGPTEAAIDVTYHPTRPGSDRASVPIGRPVANTRVHVLDRQGREQPVGVAGELALGGVQIARGYHGRPALTADRFVPDPFSGTPLGGEPGERLYRTGDLARWVSPPGGAPAEVEFLGRLDHQVKVRGFRIELGEIEAALSELEPVREAVVSVWADRSGEPRLVAHVVAAHPGAPPTLAELRDGLAPRLPDYMLPSSLVVMEEMPLNPSGKVDRKKLPDPKAQKARPAGKVVVPRTPAEELVANLFRVRLEKPTLSVDDDFFEAGGSSLAGAVLINEVQELLGEIVQVVALFDAPTVEEFAAYLEREYPVALARVLGQEVERVAVDEEPPVDLQMFDEIRRLIPVRQVSAAERRQGKNPPAVFVLAPPRSGTTLLRVMLAGHPELFAPPELELLPYATLAEREADFGERDRFRLDGAVRAVMEAEGVDLPAARGRIAEMTEAGATTGELYQHLQEASGARLLVDKTPTYPWDLETLRAAEELFDRPLYVHLTRHPYGMVRSFEEARLDKIFFRREHPFTRRQLAELLWTVSHQNIERFFAEVPEERRFALPFEALVRRPEETMRELARFLGVDYHEAMIRPYDDRTSRMTDGVEEGSRMIGDVKFHQHREIDPAVADRWRESYGRDFLAEVTWNVAESLGYGRDSGVGGTAGRALPPLEPGDWSPGEPLPLSVAQERLWFLDQLDPGSATYNMPARMRFRGALDLAAVARSLDALVLRQAGLRTHFVGRSGRPAQVVEARVSVALPVVDLSGLSRNLRRAEARRLVSLEARRPFDLAEGPLLRALAVRRDGRDHALAVTVHHIVSDGWSMTVLMGELAHLYAHHAGHGAPELSPLPLQYADFALWQRRWVTEDVLARQLAYWREQLADVPVLELPTDRPRPAFQTFDGATVPFTLEPSVTEALDRISRESGATRFAGLLGAFSTFLARWAGQDDVAVGSPFANRNRAEVQSLVGFFVSTLVLRLRLDGALSFEEVLERSRRVMVGAFGHQDVPFERLVQELTTGDRSLSVPPLFQVMLALQGGFEAAAQHGMGGRPLELGDLVIERAEGETTVSKFDLSLSLGGRPEGALDGRFVYNVDLFDRSTVERMGRSFDRFVRALVAEPGRPVTELALLPEAELRQVLVDWNRPKAPYQTDAMVPALVAEIAAASPERVAVRFDGAELTYGELVSRARHLARELSTEGARPEVVVGVAAVRSFELVVALLAVLETGAGYLPLDPALPDERLALMLADADVPLALAGDAFAQRLGALAGNARVLALEPLVARAAVAGEAHRELPPRGAAVEPEAMAYLIYTSGSTGRPKGVAVSHRSLAHRLGYVKAGDLHPDARFLQKTTTAFDVSILEIFGPLVVGAVTVLAKPGGEKDTDYLTRLIADERVTHTSFPPTLLYALLDEERFQALDSLEVVITGGETVPAELPERFYARLARLGSGDEREVRLMNRYGPTETSISVTSWTAQPGARERVLPIGRPTAQAEIYILDAHLRPVPVGVPGELVIGGPVVARGYLGRPRETAVAFVPHPFPEVSGTPGEMGARVYRSGDLARFRPAPDGGPEAVEFVGRIDDQVKVRGFRVELGEIETALARRDEVQEAAVVDRGEGAAKVLVAYLVTAAAGRGLGEGDLVARLEEALAEELPAYMVPSAFVVMDELPLTATGKVDRKALPEPRVRRRAGAVGEGTDDDAPRGPVEEVIATVWKDVLGVEWVGRNDSFFDLGGHSLMATQVVSRLRQAFGVELALRTLFERSTVAGLATAVETARAAASGARVLPPPESLGRPEPWTGPVELPLSFAQERLWFLDRLQPGTATYNMPTSLRLGGELDRAALARTLRLLARRHESLRTTFAFAAFGEGGERPVQRVVPPSAARQLARLPVADLSGLPEDVREAEARRLATAEAARPFDLEAGPLARFTLLALGPDDHQYLATLHHIVSDGWSVGLLVAELTRTYAAFVAGREPELPALSLQVGDHAAWQRRHVAGEELSRQLDYWRGRLAGAPPVLELPMDRPRPPAQRFRGATERFRFAPELTQGVERLGRSHEATPFMVMVAAVSTLYGRLAGTDDVVLGTPVAGRDRVEVEGLVGLFLNSLVLRVEMAGEPTFAELLSRVRETTLGAYAHASVPFEKLVEELAPVRSLAHAPLYQHTVVLQNTPQEARAPEGLAIRPAPAERDITRFDSSLSLAVSELGLAGGLVYNRDLYDRSTIRRVIDRFELLLSAVVEDSGRPLAELPVVTDAERRQIAVWNDTDTDWEAGDVTLHGLIEAQAVATPDAVAVVEDDGASLTYGALLERSGAVAAHLAGLGLGSGTAPETVVAIACERSLELMVGLLGILRAGAAYVPLDPSYPEHRLAFMMEDSGAPVVLAQEALADRLPVPEGVRVVALSPGGAVAGADGSAEVGPVPVFPAGLAYVIYTSGSTGRPKGAMNSHRGIVNRLLWMQSEYGLGADDVVLQKTPVSFDVSVWELFWPLLAGARLVLARPEGHKDPAYLVRAVRRHAVTTMHFVPSMLQVFLTAPGVAECATLERVIASGEALPRDLVERWYARRPTPLHNLYGPTEAAVDVSHHATTPGAGPGPVPIGRPVANTALQVVDRNLDPVPLGSAGELLIGGVQLARGYHGRPALTAERFVPDPSAPEPGARVYRTGDLARWVESDAAGGGELEFLGRLDHQVKLRGFRIEPGEIESALAALPEVREAAVVLDDSGLGGPRLVAYLVPAEGDAEGLDTEAVAAALGDRCPEYMVPAVLVPIYELPLNPSGKVDRKRLPALDGPVAPEARGYVAPRTPAEELVAGLWAEHLGLDRDRVGARDAFFEIGGNSLTGAVFVNTLQERLAEIVHVVALFDQPTVERFAAYLEREYPAALARLLGTAPADATGEAEDTEPPVDAGTLAAFRRLVPERRIDDAERRGPKNPRAVFVLAPPRSGTTLLRVMLAGHPELFAPPELELLPYATLRERSEAFSGRDAYRLEGAIRALMEAADLTAEEARERIEEMTEDGALATDLYRLLQESIDDRLLVDKTPTYAWQPGALTAAEELFDEPRYIQLVRHPYGMVRSFEEARLDQIFFRHDHPFSRRRLAELLWTVSHQNVERFFEGVPQERRVRLSFEELVQEPEATMRRLAAFLEVDYHPAMVRPYESGDEERAERMTDGLHEESRMIGDVKFHQHREIDPKVADTWRSAYRRDFLGEETWSLAEALGVGERLEKKPVKLPPSVVALSPGEDRAPLFLVHPVSGETTLYRRLVGALGGERPVYGFESAGFTPGDDAAPLATVEAQADRYLASLDELHPEGPVLLAGSSMGGLVVYEMARRLERQGREVRLAAMLDTVHPEDLPETFGAEGVTESLFLRFFTAGRISYTPAELAAVGPEARPDFLLEQIAGALPDGLPPGLDRERLERLLAVVDANRRAMLVYRPGPYGGAVTYLRSGERAEGKLQLPDASWEPLVAGGLTVEQIPGTHLSMHMPPHVVDLAAALRRAIDANEGALVAE